MQITPKAGQVHKLRQPGRFDVMSLVYVHKYSERYNCFNFVIVVLLSLITHDDL